MPIDKHAIEILQGVSTATLTTILSKKGIHNAWLRRAKALRPGQGRIVGPAFTLRFMPWRDGPTIPSSAELPASSRPAIEAMPEGYVAVVDAMGVDDASIFGDIMCTRMHKRGVAALVTDGAVRDAAGVAVTGLAVWCSGAAAAPISNRLMLASWQVPIGCGGVAVFPDDIIVVDEDGAVVIPPSLLDAILDEGPEQEQAEAWIIKEVRKGHPLPGLYPMNDETKQRYGAERGRIS